MKLFIEIPTWLGDSVMSSGAIDAVIDHFDADEVIIFGNFVELFAQHKKVTKLIKDDRKHRFTQLFKLPKVDVAISFRRSLYSKILVNFVAKRGYTFTKSSAHQVEQYSNYVNTIINADQIYTPRLHFTPKQFPSRVIGINPGATYGSAKRWYPAEFAKVANQLHSDIIIFGGPDEVSIANDIQSHLTISNYQNLCGKLSIPELCEYIGGLDLLITNDSGPMHIAAAFGVPVVAIFGPTKYTETSPYNTRYKIVKKDLECSGCMQRECPLGHHRCMREISADDVLKAIHELQQS